MGYVLFVGRVPYHSRDLLSVVHWNIPTALPTPPSVPWPGSWVCGETANYAGFGEVPHLRLDAAKTEIWSLTMTTGNILKKCTWTCIISWRRKSKRFIPEPG